MRLLPRLLALIPILASPLVFGCDDGSLSRLKGELDLERTVDFGAVQVGILKTVRLPISNVGGTSMQIERIDVDGTLSGDRYEFRVDTSGFTVQPGGMTQLELGFRPFEAADEPYQTELVLKTDEEPITLTLMGLGVASGLIVDPNPVDFGTVLTGSSDTIQVKVTNALTETVRVTTRVARGAVEIEAPQGTDLFAVTAPVAPDRSLGELAPGESLTLPVIYRPTTADQTDRARFYLSNCESDLCEKPITLIGRGTSFALVCTPDVIDFGSVSPGTTRRLSTTCKNVASAAIMINDVGLTLATDSAYRLTPPPLPIALEPGESTDIEVAFSATQEAYDSGATPMGAIEIESADPMFGALDVVNVALTGRSGGPAVSILPDVIDFGMVALNTTSTHRVVVINDGLEELVVSTVDPDVAMTGAFRADQVSFIVPPGGVQVVEETFAPQSIGLMASTLVFATNDSANPMPSVTLTGEGVDLPPCAHRVLPAMVQFGAVPLNETPTQSVSIENIGTDVCLFNDIDFVEPIATATNAYELVNGPETGILLAPGEMHDVPIRYTPSRVSLDRATLGYYVSDPRDSNPTVPIVGIGEPLLDITCPAQVTTPVGTPVTLSVMAQVLGANITGYQWTIGSAPTGGVGTPNQWSPDPPDAPTEDFLPYIVGNYDLLVEVFDDQGRTNFCTTHVVAQGEGLVVTLTWNGSGDVDLHLHDQLPTPWFSGTDDCYYSNLSPIWDPAFPAGQGPNPQLDFDNTFANGPENTRVSTVVIGQPYTIGVHSFAAAAGRNATLDIYCGGVVSPTYSVTSAALSGNDAGDCTTNDFWRVATVVFTNSGNCTVTPIDTYLPSSQACTTF